jgi:hypothetical protein
MRLFPRPHRSRKAQQETSTEDELNLDARLALYRVDREIDATIEIPADAPTGLYASTRRARELRGDRDPAPPRERW